MTRHRTRSRVPFPLALLAVATVLGTAYTATAWWSVGRWWAFVVAAVVTVESVVVAAAGHILTTRAEARAARRAARWAQPFTISTDTPAGTPPS